MSDVKQVTLSGGAAMEWDPTAKKKRTRRSKGGDAPSHTPGNTPSHTPGNTSLQTPGNTSLQTPGNTSLQTPGNASSQTPGNAFSQTPGTTMNKVYHPASLGPVSLGPAPSKEEPEQEGGTKAIRVELKKRTTAKKVLLQPKKEKEKKEKHTKKARKVTLGVAALHKRMKRAKGMTRKAKEMPLAELREQLIQKKLIQPTSKAPESVLRQIAADAQIVAGKAL